IHPRVLTDRGLPQALRELADDAAVPVTVEADFDERPAPLVEAMAYFAVAEALTNIAKHAEATTAQISARVTGRRGGRRLTVEIRDDGRGGARPGDGSGLTGMADRMDVVHGAMLVSSPPGGPTVVRLEIPWLPRPSE
ncbi:MAG: ATP-binding protein, partial [Bifidobacteriaceae bacterium]|nr:ATP-binding protein [Bifidobacteriaceae bacterium]